MSFGPPLLHMRRFVFAAGCAVVLHYADAAPGCGDKADDASRKAHNLEKFTACKDVFAGTGHASELGVETALALKRRKVPELKAMCKERDSRCGSKKRKADIISCMVQESQAQAPSAIEQVWPNIHSDTCGLCNGDKELAIGYSEDLMNPDWVAYKLTNAGQSSTNNHRTGFTLDPTLKRLKVTQTPSAAYANTAYDRGHLAPSLAMSRNWRGTKTDLWKASYYVSNISPQARKVNQRGWMALEAAVHNHATTLHSSAALYVVTGLAYEDRKAPKRVVLAGVDDCDAVDAPSSCTDDDTIETEEQPDETIQVADYYYKAICDTQKKMSAVYLLENDEQDEDGFPAGAVEVFTPQDLDDFFDIQLNFPKSICGDPQTSAEARTVLGRTYPATDKVKAVHDQFGDGKHLDITMAFPNVACTVLGRPQRITFAVNFGSFGEVKRSETPQLTLRAPGHRANMQRRQEYAWGLEWAHHDSFGILKKATGRGSASEYVWTWPDQKLALKLSRLFLEMDVAVPSKAPRLEDWVLELVGLPDEHDLESYEGRRLAPAPVLSLAEDAGDEELASAYTRYLDARSDHNSMGPRRLAAAQVDVRELAHGTAKAKPLFEEPQIDASGHQTFGRAAPAPAGPSPTTASPGYLMYAGIAAIAAILGLMMGYCYGKVAGASEVLYRMRRDDAVEVELSGR